MTMQASAVLQITFNGVQAPQLLFALDFSCLQVCSIVPVITARLPRTTLVLSDLQHARRPGLIASLLSICATTFEDEFTSQISMGHCSSDVVGGGALLQR